MHPINKALSKVGLQLTRFRPAAIPESFWVQYRKAQQYVVQNKSRFRVVEKYYSQPGEHPISYIDHECAFAAKCIAARKPESILDVGSYRHFILGLLADRQISTIDVRPRTPATANEIVITSDAKKLEVADESFDAVVSLCSLEHFGLGRYGDEFDLDADKKAIAEMTRVLKPGGVLILSTTLTRAQPSIAFNGLRIYDYPMITEFRGALSIVEETFISNRFGACSFDRMTDAEDGWDVYCGCWRK